jgi:hypothetical protein
MIVFIALGVYVLMSTDDRIEDAGDDPVPLRLR